MDVIERSKISYWETRTINIGNYEKRECGLSISHSVIEPLSGHGNKKVQIEESASATIDNGDVKDINKVSNYLINIVTKKLDAKEKQVRTATMGWEGIDFDTEKKMVKFGIIDQDDYTGEYKKRHQLDAEDLEN